MKKKAWILILIILFLVAGASFVYFRFIRKNTVTGSTGRYAYVENVGNICGYGLGDSTRMMGIVESQETKKVEKDSDKPVKEAYVKVGDSVNEGDPLFIYDTEEMQMTLESKELELESLKNTIDSQYSSIEDLKKQRDSVSGDEKLGFSSQINSITAEIKQNEYQIKVKELEIERLKDAIQNAVVYSPMTGIVKTLNESGQSGDSYSGYGYSTSDDNAYMTIMAVGNYRVKGVATEFNIYSITKGTSVLLRSRVDETRIWRGVVTKVDQEPAKNENQDYYYNSGESASKYNFYVDLDDVTDLILGQHLYVELDLGQQDEKTGLRLYSYYIVNDEEGSHYVWKKGDDGRMVKTVVTLGDYDENMDTYEIVSGLLAEDYIAFPDGSIAEGDIATTNYEDIMNQEYETDEVNYEGIEGSDFNYEEIDYDTVPVDEESFQPEEPSSGEEIESLGVQEEGGDK